MAEGERIARRIARAGLCSRRDAERLIADGRVFVNGKRIDSPALNVLPEDRVEVNGEKLKDAEAARLWMFYKPTGCITTSRDPEGRKTIYDILPETFGKVLTIGRLDLNSEGLLLLTNDGALKRHLELPSTGWKRRYRVRVFGTPSDADFKKLAAGLKVGDMQYGQIEAAVDKVQGSNCWLTVSLKEGKNREIRRVFEALGYQVSRLIRVAYGPFQLGTMEKGEVKEVTGKVMREQLGGVLGQDKVKAQKK